MSILSRTLSLSLFAAGLTAQINTNGIDSVLRAGEAGREAARRAAETRARIDLMKAEADRVRSETNRAQSPAIPSQAIQSLTTEEQIALKLGQEVRVPDDAEINTAFSRMVDRYPDFNRYSVAVGKLVKSFLPGKQISTFEYLQGLYVLAKYTELSSIPAAERGTLMEPLIPNAK